MKEELALSGATTLPEIRQLLIEWFSSTDVPENEDCEAVSSFLASLVNNKELHKIEPIILFLKRYLKMFQIMRNFMFNQRFVSFQKGE